MFYEPGDVVIEAVGLPELWEQALQMVCKGEDITLFGGRRPGPLYRGGHRALALLAADHTGPLPLHPLHCPGGLRPPQERPGRPCEELFISEVRPLEDVVDALESHGCQQGTKYKIGP